MAKALIGHVDVDRRESARLVVENIRLRARVAELEALVLRLCPPEVERPRSVTADTSRR